VVAVSIPYEGVDSRGEPYRIVEAQGRYTDEYLAHLKRICAETPYMLQSSHDPLPNSEQQFKLLERFRSWDNSLCLLALRSSRPRYQRVVGSITFLGGRTMRTAHACTLGMGVDKGDWAQGLGSNLLDTGLAWVRNNRIMQRVSLKVFVDNTAALHLYETRGFVREGRLEREVALDNETVDLIPMGLDVS
jgi:RimJ/RimL family protein N-acetyltransferase